MSKSLKNSNLSERSPIRALLAVSLCASMAAFGCTTDRTLGNGDPVVTPGSRTSPTSGTSAGSESGALPPPMMSSFSNGSVPVLPRTGRLTADAAAAIMLDQQPRVRVLGPVAPGPGRPYLSDQMMASQQQGAAQTSVNSTIYSGPTEVITSGAGEPVAAVDAIATAGSTVAANPGTSVTNASAPVIAPAGTAITPTSSAVSTPGAFASVRTLSPTAASVVNPPASVSGSPAVAATSSSRTNTTTQQPITTSNTAVANPVRVLNSNGRLTITNSATTNSTTPARQQ